MLGGYPRSAAEARMHSSTTRWRARRPAPSRRGVIGSEPPESSSPIFATHYSASPRQAFRKQLHQPCPGDSSRMFGDTEMSEVDVQLVISRLRPNARNNQTPVRACCRQSRTSVLEIVHTFVEHLF